MVDKVRAGRYFSPSVSLGERDREASPLFDFFFIILLFLSGVQRRSTKVKIPDGN